jgi:hypothetical protein
MHACEDYARTSLSNWASTRRVIPENAKRLSGTQYCSRHTATGSRIAPAGFPE